MEFIRRETSRKKGWEHGSVYRRNPVVCREFCAKRMGFLRWLAPADTTKHSALQSIGDHIWRRWKDHLCPARSARKGTHSSGSRSGIVQLPIGPERRKQYRNVDASTNPFPYPSAKSEFFRKRNEPGRRIVGKHAKCARRHHRIWSKHGSCTDECGSYHTCRGKPAAQQHAAVPGT